MVENQKLQLPPISSTKINELDVKIDLNQNLIATSYPKSVSFSSLLSAKNNSVKRKMMTPLVEYINSMSLNENKIDETISEPEVNVPLIYENEKEKNYANKKKKKNVKEKVSRENNNDVNTKDNNKPNEKIINAKVAQNKKNLNNEKKNQIKISTSSATPKEQQIQSQSQKQKQPKQKEKEKLVENNEIVTQIKGTPKILSRKPAVTESSGFVAKTTVNTGERITYYEMERAERNNLDETITKPEIKELKAKGPDSKKIEIKKPGKKTPEIVIKKKQDQEIINKQKQEQVQEIIKIKTQESNTSIQPLPTIKKVFTSASKLRDDSKKNES